MKQYIRIQKTMTAAQFDGTPGSVVAVLTVLGLGLDSSVTITKDVMRFEDAGEERQLDKGDWIVKDGDFYSVLSDKWFKADFIAVEDLPKGTPIPTEANNSQAAKPGPETESVCNDPSCMPCQIRKLLATLKSAPNAKKTQVTALGPFSSMEDAEKAIDAFMATAK